MSGKTVSEGRRRRRLKLRWKILIALAAILVPFVLVWVIADALGAAAVRREVAKIEAAGEPITWAGLAPPPVPDAENAALLYQRAFDLLIVPRGDTADEFVSAVEGSDAPWDRERREWLADVLASQHKFQVDPQALTEAAVWRVVDGYLEAKAPAFDLLHRAATMDHCWFDVQYDQGMLALLPHLGSIRTVVRRLDLDARRRFERGDAAGAYKDVATMLRTHRVGRQPFLVSFMVEALVLRIALARLRECLGHDGNRQDEWRSLLVDLAEPDVKDDFVRALQGERQVFRWAADLARDHPSRLAQLGTGGPPKTDVVAVLKAILWRPVLRSDEATGLGCFRDLIALARRPGHEAVAEIAPFDQRLAAAPRWASMTQILLPSLSASVLPRVRTEADLALARTAVALKLYKAEHGAYPEQLAALAPEILAAVPDDPWTGNPLTYRRQGDGFLLYSVGEDLTDDGGREPPEPSGRPTTFPAQNYDMVWRFEQ